MPEKHFRTILFTTTMIAAGITWVGVRPVDFPARDVLPTVTGVPHDVRFERKGGFTFDIAGSGRRFEWNDSNPARDAIWRGLHAGAPVTVRYIDRDWSSGHVDVLEIADATGVPIEPYKSLIERADHQRAGTMAAAVIFWLFAVFIAFVWARAWSRGKPGTYWAVR